MLTNFQIHDHGAGYLRLVHFDPRHGRVTYTTVSPFLHRSITNGDAQFTFTGVDLR